jgi:hypothetical protein
VAVVAVSAETVDGCDSALTAPPIASETIIQAAASATRMRFGRVVVAVVATALGFMVDVFRLRRLLGISPDAFEGKSRAN